MGESCRGQKNVFHELGHDMQGKRTGKLDFLNVVFLCKLLSISMFCGEGSFWKVCRVGSVVVHSGSERCSQCGIVERS